MSDKQHRHRKREREKKKRKKVDAILAGIGINFAESIPKKVTVYLVKTGKSLICY